jgi:peptide/nickel transport system substrate-binding protein
MSEEDMSAMMSDQIAAQVAAMAAANPGLSADEVNAMIAGAVADSSAMLADQLAMMGDEAMSDEEMAAMMEEAITSAVDEAVMMAMPEEAPEEAMMEPGMSGPKHGGTLSVATTGFLSFDVDQIGVGAGGEFFYFHRAFEGLIERGPEDELVNRLVQSWEANDDLSVYTINVQPGVKFHDGEDLTSEDIKYTIDRMLTPESASPVKATLKYVESIEAPDSHTLIFNLNGSNAEFPRDLADYHLRVLPSHVDYSQITDGSTGGSGSFVKVSHNAAEKTAYVRNSNYWEGEKPYVDQLVLYYMPEVTTRVEALRAGATDYGDIEDFTQAKWFEDHDRILVKSLALSSIRNFTMDNREPGMYLRPGSKDETDLIEAGSVFHDKNLRKAVQYAYDREFVREATFFGYGFTANDHPVGLTDQYYLEGQIQVDQDIDKAKEYLAAAGYADGIDITLDAMEAQGLLNMALAFKESVSLAGINVEVVNHPRDTYWTEIWLVTPFNSVSWTGRPASQALSLPLRSTGDWNESHWNSPRFDELLDLALTELDFQKRKDYYAEIQEILIEEVPTTYAMYSSSVAAHWNHVFGVALHPYTHTFYQNWWIEK